MRPSGRLGASVIGVFTAFALGACTSDELPTSANVDIVPTELAFTSSTVGVCHRRDDGNFRLISVSVNAVPQHQAHGDGVPLGAVPGGDLVFDASCTAIVRAASISIVPATFQFDDTALGSTSSSVIIPVTNTSGTILNLSRLSGLVFTGDAPDFVVLNNTCTPQDGSLAVGAACEVTIKFAPTAVGTRSTVMTINVDGGSGDNATLTGAGLPQPAFTLFPGNLNFGSQTPGSASAVQTVILVAKFDEDASIGSIVLAGPNATEFVQTNTCGATVPALTFCNIFVTFQPTSSGGKTATLNVTDGVTGAVQQVSLVGTGS